MAKILSGDIGSLDSVASVKTTDEFIINTRKAGEVHNTYTASCIASQIVASAGGLIIPTPYAVGDIIYASSTSAFSKLALGAANKVLSVNAGATGLNYLYALNQNLQSTDSPTFVGLTLSGFTSGSIVFATTSGILTQNNGKFFWDNTNFRLGLNVATPSTDISFGSGSARTIAVESAASGAGNSLTLKAGSSTQTDVAGGQIIVSGGDGRGTQGSTVAFYAAPTGSTGSTLNSAREIARWNPAGKLLIGNSSPLAFSDITWAATAARIIAVDRRPGVDSSTGFGLTLQAGSASSNATNATSGNLNLRGGISTGNTASWISIFTASAAGSGTADNAEAENFRFIGNKLGLNNLAPNSVFHNSGTVSEDKITAVSGTYTILNTDYILNVDTTGARSITLPDIATSGVGVGKVYIVADVTGSANTNNITVNRGGTNTINGATTNVINTAYGAKTLRALTSSLWVVV